MIALAWDCLLLRLADGESVPLSADMISVDMMGEAATLFDEEFVRHAAKAVFHYYKHELGRETLSVGEFAQTLEKALGGFTRVRRTRGSSGPRMLETDLRRLAHEAGKGCELIFFPRLREELREQLQRAPGVVRFRGLRG